MESHCAANSFDGNTMQSLLAELFAKKYEII
jgi:hypothetical protein